MARRSCRMILPYTIVFDLSRPVKNFIGPDCHENSGFPGRHAVAGRFLGACQGVGIEISPKVVTQPAAHIQLIMQHRLRKGFLSAGGFYCIIAIT